MCDPATVGTASTTEMLVHDHGANEKRDRSSQLKSLRMVLKSETEMLCVATTLIDSREEESNSHHSPFLSRLLRRLLAASGSSSSLSFLADSDELSQLSCRFNAVSFRLEARLSGVFFAEEAGLSNRLGSGVKLFGSLVTLRLTLVKPAFAGVNPPELTAVNPPDVGA